MADDPFPLSGDERALLRKHRLAVFANRIIHDAEPPITPEQRAQVEARIEGELPEELVRLWETSFGGRLDYDLYVSYGAELHQFSWAELFHPGSAHYHDLFGWMDHETELLGDALDDAGQDWNGLLPLVPIGGFEYLERIYVRTSPEAEAGAVLAWSHGLPPSWVGCLNEDSSTTIAGSLIGALGLLRYYDDPLDPGSDYGGELLEAIEPLAADGPAGEHLAQRLHELMRTAMVDWKEMLSAGALAGDPATEQVALQDVLRDDDLALLQQLAASGVQLSTRRRGGLSALDAAAAASARRCFQWLLDQDLPADKTILYAASSLTADQVSALLDRGAPVTLDAIRFSAGRARHLDALSLLCLALCEQHPEARVELTAALHQAAAHELDFAAKMRAGRAGSYRTAEETEAQGRALIQVADELASRSNG